MLAECPQSLSLRFELPDPSQCFGHAWSFHVGSVHPFLQKMFALRWLSSWLWHMPFERQLSPGAQHAVFSPLAAAVALQGMYRSKFA